jgi:O-Antigen ligase
VLAESARRGLTAAVWGCAPAVVVAVSGFWAGTVAGGATAVGAAVGEGVLLVAVLAAAWSGGLSGGDPLGLGRQGRLLALALWVAVAAGVWASPVGRAGVVGVLLLPAFVGLAATVGKAWRGEVARRWGLRGVAVVAGVGAGWGLAARFLAGVSRVAEPIGHHEALAVWLLALLPLAVLPAGRGGSWRAVGWGAGVLGVAALVAARSVVGLAGLAVEAGLLLVWLPRGSRWRRWGGAAALVAVVVAVAVGWGRVAALATGADPSLRARWVYTAAGWRGFLARPMLGWGAGSTAWTLAGWLRPVPGVNPPGEVVAELHSLPVRLLFELGATGSTLTVAGVGLFVWRRVRELAAGRPAADVALGQAGLAGLAGAGVALLGTAWLEVTALPVALAVAAGAALSGGQRRAGTGNGEEGYAGGTAGTEPGRFNAGGRATPACRLETAGTEPGRFRRLRGSGWASVGAGVYVLVAVAILLPLDRAQFAYDRAVAAEGGAVERPALTEAVRLDPGFPFYRAALAWSLEAGGDAAESAGVSVDDATPAPAGGASGRRTRSDAAASRERGQAVELARRAALAAPGVAPFWLTAGVFGADAGEPWAAAALDRACALDPLGALAPFYRMTLDPAAPAAAEYGARALLAAPELAAATFWEGREELLSRALAEVEEWPGVDAGWRQVFVTAVRGWNPDVAGTVEQVALRLDPAGAASLPLRAFRRRPQGWWLVPVEIRRELAAQVRVPAATVLPTSSPAAFPPSCGHPR